MLRYLHLSFLLFPILAQSQMSGSKLLEKAIEFHDPNGNWKSFNGHFRVTMQTPNSSDRISDIYLNLPEQLFSLKVDKDDTSYTYTIEKDNCSISLHGRTDFSKQEAEKHRLNCERGTMYKNYYTYLYGLPMKLKDDGTLIDPEIQRKKFKGKEYLVLKATYEQEVGDDIWYFYFDPTTYAMKVYQFYHDESKNDGEYILLSGMEEISGIKMPKKRAWYYNKDDKYLGTDILER
ncbi:DUF6503 family protein [Allomuricauda sp. d1]|uniref:DUF6503 family protein n=1 Tax=Allomuricauda sp. d1 TaxID=3136725 RepID=UPI0031D5B51B